MTQVEEIKSKLKIEELIGETLTVIGRGRTLTTKEHDSLKIFTTTQSWHWFSQAKGGDVFDWYQLQHKCDFRTALEELAKQAAVELRQLTEVQRTEIATQRAAQTVRFEILEMAASYYAAMLWSPDGEPGRRYCTGRGWTDETIKRERIGFCPAWGDKKALSAQEPLHRQLMAAGHAEHPLAKAVLSIPGGMIVYAHQDRGRVVYLSARSIQGKRHYNLPEMVALPEGSGNLVEAAGMKQPYLNDPVRHAGRGGARVLVEGQADAISLGQLGIDAAALCGLALGDLPGEFSHVGFDNDDAGQEKALDIALACSPLCRVILWPEKWSAENGPIAVKDASDMVRAGATSEDIESCMEVSPRAIQRLAERIRKMRRDDDKKALLRQFFDIYSQLDKLDATDMKPLLAKSFEGISQFNRMLSAYQEEKKAEELPTASRAEVCPGKFVGGYLFEQFVEWNADGVPSTFYWVRYPNGELKRQTTLDVGDITYIPIRPETDENIREQTILLPSELDANYGGEKDLLDQIRRFIHKWMDIDTHMERIASYYVLFTWFYDAGFETVPYMRALGDYGTGKTRFIESIGYLCFRPMLISGGDSEPVIFRMINTYRGTMVVDEADFKDSEANALIAKIINMGNRISGNIKRIGETPDGEELIRVFKTFCPKVFASRQGFQDQAMDSRCLTYYTTKSNPRPDVPKDTDLTFREEARQIRNRLAHYRLKTWRPMQVNHSLTDNTIMARLAQVTLALRTIISDTQALAELDRFIHEYNDDLIQDRGMSREAIVVQAIAEIWFMPVGLYSERDLSMQGIAEKAQTILAELDPEDKPFSPRGVGEILNKRLGLRARTEQTKRQGKGRRTLSFDEAMLKDLMKRYGVELSEDEEE